MKFFSLTQRTAKFLAAGVVTLGLTALVSAGLAFNWQSQAAATTQPNYSVYFRKNSTTAEVQTSLTDLNVGDTVHVYMSVGNPTEGNTIDNLQIYAPFSHRGIFNWIKADGLGEVTSHTKPSIQLSNGRSLSYKPNSTRLATNESGSYVFTDIADIAGGSKLFSNSSDTNTGFHLQNVKAGTTPGGDMITYIAKYELEVKEGNTVVFNQHSQDAETFMVRRVGETEWKTSLDGFNAGDQLEFRVYVHNNTRGNIAINTRVGVENWTSTSSAALNLTGYVDADNAERAKSSVSLTDNAAFQLQYVPNSTVFRGRPTMDDPYFDPSVAQAEGITTPAGIVMGTGNNGSVDGCWDFVTYAYFRATIVQEPVTTPTPTPTATPKPGQACFEIRIFEDFNGNGHKDENEPGLNWDAEWRYDADSTWTAYTTFADRDGKGAHICIDDQKKTLARLVVKDWCKPTTATQLEQTLKYGETHLFQFGCRRDKPAAQTPRPVTQLPRTGITGEMLLGAAGSLAAAGIGLTLLRRRVQN